MDLVQIMKGEPMTTTLILAEGMKLDHRSVMKLVTKYEKELNCHGVVRFEIAQIKGPGRRWKFAWINEEQFVFLVTLMRNTEMVLKFKSVLTKEFFRLRRIIANALAQQATPEWIGERTTGKVARREETDTIKAFVQYAKDAGSENSKTYYSHYTKATNKALFILEAKFPSLRDVLSGHQLQILAAAETAVTKAIRYGMEQGMDYHDIFDLAKKRLITFGEIVGKSIVPVSPLALDTQKSLKPPRDEKSLQETVF